MKKFILLCGLSLLVLAACSSAPTPTGNGNSNSNVTCKNASVDCNTFYDDGKAK